MNLPAQKTAGQSFGAFLCVTVSANLCYNIPGEAILLASTFCLSVFASSSLH